MTALAGFWAFGGQDCGERCASMLASQSVYGQQSAHRTEGGIALGRRLYRLLPEDRFDRRPIVGGDGSLLLVADIRIDYRDDLATALGLSADEAGLLCDAALLMRAIERWGEETVDRVIGDYAFALWDKRRRRLVLARDFAGRRPLHYHRGEGFFAFASMPKGLHALAEIPYAPDPAGAADFLALLPPAGSGTFFAGIHRVQSGEIVTITADRISSRRFWQPDTEPLRLAGAGEYAEALRERLDAAVATRLRGTGGRVAAHLSAGLDSSGVAATAARILAPGGGKVVAFTAVPRPGVWGRPGSLTDEGPRAAETASLYPNMEHVRIGTEGRSPLDALDRTFFLYERPALNLCNAMWLDAIKDAAKERGLSVMLTGQMGNQTFSYGGEHFLPHLLGRLELRRLAAEVGALLHNGARPASLAALALGPYLPPLLWRLLKRLRGGATGLLDHSVLDPASGARIGVFDRAAAVGFDFTHRPQADGFAARLGAIREADPGNSDKGTLAGWGIDYRDPSADRRLAEFCLRVPLDRFLAGGVFRALAREALADRVPESVLRPQRKGYQGADWIAGLQASRAHLSEEVGGIARNPAAAGMMDTGRLARLAATLPSRFRGRPADVREYRLALLRGVSVGHFLRKAARTND